MNAVLRKLVASRADQRCEYCRLPQAAATYLSFHVEHIRAQQHVLDDSPNNLALACPDCNRFKGPNLSSIDPESNRIVTLFNPRRHKWKSHFRFDGPTIHGVTATGRATVALLHLNDEERVEMRAEVMDSNDW